jgi:thiol-disulfide isomerase/thioredoxin
MMSNWRTMTDYTRSTVRRLAALLPAALATFGALGATLAASGGLMGHSAPDFALPAVVGSNVRLSEYRGQPVILSFWSSQCSTCIKQLAALDKLYGTYRSAGLVVFGVSVDDNLARAQQYARSRNTTFPLLLVLIDRSGVVRYLHSDNGADERSYVVQIRTLLDDKPALP